MYQLPTRHRKKDVPAPSPIKKEAAPSPIKKEATVLIPIFYLQMVRCWLAKAEKAGQ